VSHEALHGPGSLTVVALAWAAMMTAMMAPTAAPWVFAFHRFALARGDEARRLRSTLSFVAGYVLVWSLFGVALALVQTQVAVPERWSGAVLIGAGVFQLTPLKRACLTHCRNPLGFLLTRWKNGPPSPLDIGLRHGAYCLGCCWALMITCLAVGFTNLWWMAALAVLTFVEQATPRGASLRVPIGFALIAAGLFVV
jgi:predicted metal-binding membrane protein